MAVRKASPLIAPVVNFTAVDVYLGAKRTLNQYRGASFGEAYDSIHSHPSFFPISMGTHEWVFRSRIKRAKFSARSVRCYLKCYLELHLNRR